MAAIQIAAAVRSTLQADNVGKEVIIPIHRSTWSRLNAEGGNQRQGRHLDTLIGLPRFKIHEK